MSGARSNVGKTHVARAVERLLPGSVRVKIGHHARKPEGDPNLYPMGTGFSTIASEHGEADFLIIESNRILEEITPECVIYLAADNPKPSAEIAAGKADITRGQPVTESKIADLAGRLGCGEDTIRRIAQLAGAVS